MKDRLLLLKEFIDKTGKISLKELAVAFPEVSAMTLRRDLARLEENNDVIRIPGGAVSVDSFLREKEAQFSKRINYMAEEKVEIAEKASKLVEPNSCVFIDGGSTTTYFARALPDDHYYVLTNAVTIAETIITKEKPTVTLLGGDLKKHNFITVGKTCRDFIDGINIQTAVMTTTGFIKETGSFTCGSQAEAEIKQSVIEKADLVIMLLDSSKINKKMPYTFSTVLNVDYIVVDKEFPEDLKASLTEKGVKVI